VGLIVAAVPKMMTAADELAAFLELQSKKTLISLIKELFMKATEGNLSFLIVNF
jgi:hypothetical protein